jgi:hypothetical protein
MSSCSSPCISRCLSPLLSILCTFPVENVSSNFVSLVVSLANIFHVFLRIRCSRIKSCLNSLSSLEPLDSLRLSINAFNVLALKFTKKRVCHSALLQSERGPCETKDLLSLFYISSAKCVK